MLAENFQMQTKARPARRRAAPGQRLRQAIQALAGGQAQIAAHTEHGWASITFAGTRHLLELDFAGEPAVAAGELFIDALSDHEFTIPGQLVADANVVGVDHRLCPDPLMPSPFIKVHVELLLLEEC